MNLKQVISGRKGMHTAEYAIVFGLVIAAAVGMQTYVKRTLQARIKAGTDLMNTATSGGEILGEPIPTMQQYEPYYASSDQTTEHASRVLEKKDETGLTREEATRQLRHVGSHSDELGSSALAEDDQWQEQ